MTKICIFSILLSAMPTAAFAQDNIAVGYEIEIIKKTDSAAEYIGDSAKMPKASYTVTADKSLSQSTCKGYCGEGYMNDSQSYKGAVREEGSGKVYATSDYVHGWNMDRIFWDWV